MKKKTIENLERQGVILVKQDQQMIAVDRYTDTRHAEELWRSWIDTLSWQSDSRSRFVLSDLVIPEGMDIDSSTDNQIAFLLNNFKPERTTDSYRTSYARINGIDPYDVKRVDGYITQDPARFRRYEATRNPMAALLNDNSHVNGLAVENGRFNSMQRLYQEYGGISFVGKRHVVTEEDVAWIFRKLEDKAVENTFGVIRAGNKQMVIHLGIGTICNCMVDVPAVVEAARRMNADKVWFVHNHPSGSVKASREDLQIHRTLKLALGDTLQKSIIINTNSGHYGLFDEDTSASVHFDKVSSGKELVDIPVYSFDTKVFQTQGEENYFLRNDLEIAKFLSTQRLGERYKYSVVVADSKLCLAGLYHLPHAHISMSNLREVCAEMVSMGVDCGGRAVALYGKDDGAVINLAKHIGKYIKEMTAGQLTLLDCIQVDPETDICKSAAVIGAMEPAIDYQRKEPVQKAQAELIRVEGGRALLHVKDELQGRPAVFIRKSELKALDAGKLTLADLTKAYFPDIVVKNQECVSGFKR